MAAGATIHTFNVQLADLDRGVYADPVLRVARHPSETDTYMLTRVLAYCLEFEDGIDFTAGISATDEPAILVKDPTGTVLAWIEIGAPDAKRLHTGSKLAERTAVYTFRDPAKLVAGWAGKPMHHGADIPVHSFDPGFVERAATAIERRNDLTVSVTEGHVYLELNGASFDSPILTVPTA